MTNKCWFSDQQMGAFSAGNHLPLAVQVRGEEVSQRKYTNTDTKADTETNVRVQIQIQIHANNLLPLAAHVRGKEVSQGKKLNTRVASVSYFLPWEIFCSEFFMLVWFDFLSAWYLNGDPGKWWGGQFCAISAKIESRTRLVNLVNVNVLLLVVLFLETKLCCCRAW